MTLHVGFTGTSSGLTGPQTTALISLIGALPMDVEAHHGDCVEADATFDRLCAEACIMRHAHPGHGRNGSSPKRAYCEAEDIRESLPYLTRNRNIVACSDMLIACPRGPERQRGSGTWYTIRRAAEKGIQITIVWPDGTVEELT